MLLRREAKSPATVIERLVGMQAQVPKPPFIGLWSRIEDFRRETLNRAIERGEVVRGTMMRATLHLMTRQDFLEFRSLLAPMLTQSLRVIGDRADALNVETLTAEGRKFFKKPGTFEALRAHLQGRYPNEDERAMAYAIRLAIPLVQVPGDMTWSYPAACDFALADQFLGDSPRTNTEMESLVLRYLAAFGPATPADMQIWSAIKPLKAVFEALRPKLITLRDERGRELFDLPKAQRPDESAEAPVRFLPEYDNILLSHADRSRIIADEHRPRVATKNLRILSTFLVDGFVAGTWRIARKKTTATLVVEPFVALKKAVRDELANEGERLLRFAEEDATEFAVEFDRAK